LPYKILFYVQCSDFIPSEKIYNKMSSKNGLESSKNGLAKTIPGLRIIPNFITPEEEVLLSLINDDNNKIDISDRIS